MGVKVYSPNPDIDFYEKEIRRLKYIINNVTMKREKAIHEFDKQAGYTVESALTKLQEDLKYFQEKKNAKEKSNMG